jgi:hypothetical protein
MRKKDYEALYAADLRKAARLAGIDDPLTNYPWSSRLNKRTHKTRKHTYRDFLITRAAVEHPGRALPIIEVVTRAGWSYDNWRLRCRQYEKWLKKQVETLPPHQQPSVMKQVEHDLSMTVEDVSQGTPQNWP